MLRTYQLYPLVIGLLLTSCAKDFVNPYDPATPADIWMPSELTIDTLGRNALRLSWQQDELHIDGFIVGKEQEGKLTESELLKDSLQLSDLSVIDNDTCRWVSYRVSAFAGDNRSATLYSDSVELPLTTQANAGLNQYLNPGALGTTLAANQPAAGESGQWSVVSGSGGIFNDASEPNSLFTGIARQDYVLQWQITSACSYTSDTVIINRPILDIDIGDTYQGGIIFYLDGFGGGLIAAPTDQSTGAEWGCDGTAINGTQTGIGYGAVNTTAIVNGCAEEDIAARICNDLVLNGYSDWFLPSKDELNLMYENIGQGNALWGNIGGFTNNIYWSTSEGNGFVAWGQDFFVAGIQSGYDKADTSYVRAVRSF